MCGIVMSIPTFYYKKEAYLDSNQRDEQSPGSAVTRAGFQKLWDTEANSDVECGHVHVHAPGHCAHPGLDDSVSSFQYSHYSVVHITGKNGVLPQAQDRSGMCSDG